MSLITGVSTDLEFLNEINSKGAELTNESTAYDLATAIDETGGNVSWLSPNEVVISAINEAPSGKITINLTKHFTTTEDSQHYVELGISKDQSGAPDQLLPMSFEPGQQIDPTGTLFFLIVTSGIKLDNSKTKITIGETSYTGSDINNITGFDYLKSLYSMIEENASGLDQFYEFTSEDVAPEVDVNIEIFETGYTE